MAVENSGVGEGGVGVTEADREKQKEVSDLRRGIHYKQQDCDRLEEKVASAQTEGELEVASEKLGAATLCLAEMRRGAEAGDAGG